MNHVKFPNTVQKLIRSYRLRSNCLSLVFGAASIVGSAIWDADLKSVVAGEPTWGRFLNAAQQTEVKLPREWAPDKNIAWTSEIEGYGQSTPIVADDQVVVTSTSGENKDNYHVTSFNLADGKKRWQVDLTNPSPFKNSPMVSRAAPSAIATSNGFVAFFEGGVLAAISADGKTTWEKNLVEQYGPIEARHGLAASLEANDKHVFVWVERSDDPYVLAIDPKTGDEVWKAAGVGATSWASPRLISVGDSQHLVCSASGKIIGINPANGERLWSFDGVSNNTSCTPMPAGNGRFLIGASDGRGETTAGVAAASNGLIEITPKDDGSFDVGYKWQAKKATSSFGSPVVAGDTAAIVNRAGVLYRLDLETGERVSVDRTSAGGIWATPLVAGDLIYLFGYKGTTSVISLTDGEEVAENRCWEADAEESRFGSGKVLYAAAPASPYLLIRRGDRLYAIK
ncbi:PQQ-binding-like beta-propeller repeat protein [Roseiconus lacunae]|uniref:outer membrane protein assembly factor BamB family protein n=1 Tax=Roseiconus lacunae TaxID=2605694 RepID=UPI00308EAB9C|nr:PQQ-binding-like beta-propeller repeat protein [Stieleria sp. HD01]